MNSLVVQTLIADPEAVALDRWFDAVFDALGAGSEALSLTWRVVIGDVSGTDAIPTDAAARWAARASELGGSLTVEVVDVRDSPIESHRALAERASEGLALVLEPGTVVLATTLVRLFAALGRGDAVAAREVPLEAEQGAPRACVLWDTQRLRESGTRAVATLVCPEAVAFKDSELAPQAPPALAGEDPAGSLLEDATSPVDSAREVVARALSSSTPPLHSIVMRTQALRSEPLRDALICLAGQRDGRFEVMLVVHEGDEGAVHKVVDDQPLWLRSRVKVMSASSGTRAHPLNVGILAARGSVVSFLDDDDLVFGNWVARVLEGAGRSPRRLLRTVVAVQNVASAEWPGSLEGHAAVSSVSLPYPATFNLADHVQVNMTPFMGIAFPRGFFDVFGGADEDLHVCEDWDLVLRGAAALGVTDLPVVTAVYRRWTTGTDSYTVHHADTWERDMLRVRAKCDAAPLILPPGSASELAALSLLRATPPMISPFSRGLGWWLAAPFRAAYRLARRRPLSTQ